MGCCAAQEVPVVEVSVRAGRAIKSQPGKNEDSPELHDVINMVVDDPAEQSLSVRLVDEDGLVQKVRWFGRGVPVLGFISKVCQGAAGCTCGMRFQDSSVRVVKVRQGARACSMLRVMLSKGENGMLQAWHVCTSRCACLSHRNQEGRRAAGSLRHLVGSTSLACPVLLLGYY